VPCVPWTTVLAFLIAQNSVSAVKEVTGVASSALAPATLAGRGVIELIRADARMFPRGPNFFAWDSPKDLATLAFGSVPLHYSSERVGRQLSKAADYCPYCALLGDPEL
jgi:hypothetical protein